MTLFAQLLFALLLLVQVTLASSLLTRSGAQQMRSASGIRR